jgi:hypothetical protein
MVDENIMVCFGVMKLQKLEVCGVKNELVKDGEDHLD